MGRFKVAIIDADPLVYRCGFSVEKFDSKIKEVVKLEPLKNACYNVNSMMRKILKKTEVESYEAYLTANDGSNFRYKIDSTYKSNRKNARKPVYYNELREFLKKRWGAEVISDQEADDQCSIRHIALLTESIVCSFDKDFNNIPGWHYNYIKNELYEVSELQAYKNFYLQILTGDNSDGISRIKKGWRQKKVEEEINKCKDEKELKDIIVKVVHEVVFESGTQDPKEIYDYIEKRGRLVWLRRQPGEIWNLGL